MPVYQVQSDRELELFVRGLIRRGILAMSMLFGIVIISTIGLYLFGRDQEGTTYERIILALWDTLNMISTVGSLDEEMTATRRAWAMLVIIFGLGAALYAFGNLQGLLHGGEVRQYFARKKMQRTLSELGGHVIVCGYGRAGRSVARRVCAAGQALVVVDRSPEVAAEADGDGFLVVQADAEEERALRDAAARCGSSSCRDRRR